VRSAFCASLLGAVVLVVDAGCGTSLQVDGTPSRDGDAAAGTSGADAGADAGAHADGGGTIDAGGGLEAGIGGGDGDVGDAAATDGAGAPFDPGAPGGDATVKVFDRTPVFFDGGNGNQRTVSASGVFPPSGLYSSIVLHVTLSCPQAGCDHWDRFGTLGVVTKQGSGGTPDTVVEIARFMTPYCVGATWDYDVTDLRPLLAGSVKLQAFIDTWVPQGNPAANGGGWLLTASLDFKGGVPAKIPLAALPIWTMTQVWYGDPAKPASGSIPPQMVTLPAGATAYAMRTFVTGHGQGNADNCAEFCSKAHTLTVGTTPFTRQVWRTDCATTDAPGQCGTSMYPRAGWCPGADVKPWQADVTQAVGATTASVSYAVESYDNTCRPTAPQCAGCTLGTGCMYDGANHTEPFFYVSSLLIAYR
jgi:Peptide-N-glycosidase F, C terminal/Peptide-N-glycosidase F, N terminal